MHLITDEPWDCIHLDSLLPLKEVIPNESKFGFILRHYWLPATILTFQYSSQITSGEGQVHCCDLEIQRKMARCRSDHVLWREKTSTISLSENCVGNGENTSPAITEKLCWYNCYEQTYRCGPIVSHDPPAPVDIMEAKRRALYEMPILVPSGPNPIGFTWFAKVGDDFMNYRLDSKDYVGETAVLIVRREGRYTTLMPIESTATKAMEAIPMVIMRTGISVFALNRCIVLEDRWSDTVIDAGNGLSAQIGTTIKSVTRLIRSCPVTDTPASHVACSSKQ